MANKPPIHEIRLGVIRAAIWENSVGENTLFNVTFSRGYRDKETSEWRDTDSFGRDDLLILAKLADQAHSWIYQQRQSRANDAGPASAPQPSESAPAPAPAPTAAAAAPRGRPASNYVRPGPRGPG